MKIRGTFTVIRVKKRKASLKLRRCAGNVNVRKLSANLFENTF